MVRGSLFGRAAWLAAALVATLALACAAPLAWAIAQEGGAIEVVDTGGKGAVAADEFAADPELEPEAQASVSYRTHVQTHGWQGWRADGQVAGTSGESKRLEAIELRVEGASGGIEYRTHVQTHGWQGWRADGETSGTSGESKRLEAIEIRLTGELAETHDVFYRVHAQTFGWMGWAKDGERAGTATMGKRLEAIQVVLVAKGGAAPGDTFGGVTADHAAAYETRLVQYRTHVQTHGWQAWSYDGQTSGTSGQSKRLEALEIKIADPPCAGGVEYRTHVQTHGWQGWVADGQTSGTSGQSKRLEAVEVRLTGEMAERYDVFYRVHAQTFGWMGWAANGDTAGTEGYGKRLEAIQVVLVSKGGAAPGSTYQGATQMTSDAFKEVTTINEAAKLAYAQVMSSLLSTTVSNGVVNYVFLDIDGDGILEMLTLYHSSETNYDAGAIYAYVSNKAKRVYHNEDTFTSFYGYNFYRSSHCLVTSGGHGGLYYREYLTWDGSSIKKEAQRVSTRLGFDETKQDYVWKYDYYVNENSASEQQYDAKVRTLEVGTPVEIENWSKYTA